MTEQATATAGVVRIAVMLPWYDEPQIYDLYLSEEDVNRIKPVDGDGADAAVARALIGINARRISKVVSTAIIHCLLGKEGVPESDEYNV